MKTKIALLFFGMAALFFNALAAERKMEQLVAEFMKNPELQEKVLAQHRQVTTNMLKDLPDSKLNELIADQPIEALAAHLGITEGNNPAFAKEICDNLSSQSREHKIAMLAAVCSQVDFAHIGIITFGMQLAMNPNLPQEHDDAPRKEEKPSNDISEIVVSPVLALTPEDAEQMLTVSRKNLAGFEAMGFAYQMMFMPDNQRSNEQVELWGKKWTQLFVEDKERLAQLENGIKRAKVDKVRPVMLDGITEDSLVQDCAKATTVQVIMIAYQQGVIDNQLSEDDRTKVPSQEAMLNSIADRDELLTRCKKRVAEIAKPGTILLSPDKFRKASNLSRYAKELAALRTGK